MITVSSHGFRKYQFCNPIFAMFCNCWFGRFKFRSVSFRNLKFICLFRNFNVSQICFPARFAGVYRDGFEIGTDTDSTRASLAVALDPPGRVGLPVSCKHAFHYSDDHDPRPWPCPAPLRSQLSGFGMNRWGPFLGRPGSAAIATVSFRRLQWLLASYSKDFLRQNRA